MLPILSGLTYNRVAAYHMFQASHSNETLIITFLWYQLQIMAGEELRWQGAHTDTCGGVGSPRCVTHWCYTGVTHGVLHTGHRLVTHYTAVLLHGVQRLVGHYSITGG